MGAAARAVLSIPRVESGAPLLAGSAITSSLGLVFWIVAARQFTSAQVGLGSVVVTTTVLLAHVAQLGFPAGLARYLPSAGREPIGLIARSYAVTGGLGLVGSVVFVAGVPLWAPALDGLRSSPGSIAVFVLGSGFTTLVLLQRSVLVGLRLAPWAPVESSALGLLQIGLLVPMASLGSEFGVSVAWIGPIVVVVVIVNWLIARRVRDEWDVSVRAVAIPVRQVLRFSFTDWAAGTPRTVAIGVIPLLVLAELGSRETAHYLAAWTLAYCLFLLATAIGDAVAGPLGLAISLPLVLLVAVFAPVPLLMFGPEYADGATWALRLLLVAVPAAAVTRRFAGRLRDERRIGAVFALELTVSASAMLLGWLLLAPLGVAGVGLAWLLVLVVAAVVAIVVDTVWWWLPRFDPRRVTDVERRVATARRLAMRLPSLRLDRRVRENLRHRYTSRPSWRRVGLSDDLQTVAVAGSDGRPPLIVELARTEWGNELLARRRRNVAQLVDIDGIPSLRPLLPYPIDHDLSGELHAMIESAISGRSGDAVAAAAGPDDVVGATIAALGVMHDSSGGWLILDHDRLDRWVSEPLRALGAAIEMPAGDLDAIDRRLRDALTGVAVPCARLHGNLVLENLLFDRSGKLAGVGKWEWSDVGPVFLDRAALALGSLLVDAGTDIGHVVVDLLDDPQRLLAHRALTGTPALNVDAQVLVVLAWLHRLRPDLGAGTGAKPSQFWVARNVTPVLEHPAMAALPTG